MIGSEDNVGSKTEKNARSLLDPIENDWLESKASITEKMTKILGNSSDNNPCFCVRNILPVLVYSSKPGSVADPGFSRGGCANSQSAIIFQIFCRKLHENERIWTPGGATLAPPLRSAIEYLY